MSTDHGHTIIAFHHRFFFQGCLILFLYNRDLSLRIPCNTNSSFVLCLYSHQVWMKELASHTQTWCKRHFPYLYTEPPMFQFVPQCLWAPLRRVWLCLLTLSHQVFTYTAQLHPSSGLTSPCWKDLTISIPFAAFFWTLLPVSYTVEAHLDTALQMCFTGAK